MSSNQFSLLATNALAQYAEVYTILQKPYIGSWAEADALYSKIRANDIVREINTLVGRSPSPVHKERAKELTEELSNLTLGDKNTLVELVEQKLTQWSTPQKPKPSVKKLKNAFAVLDDDDEV